MLQVQPRLVSLLASVRGVTRVLAYGEPAPRVDARCPLLSLPLVFETRPASIPARVPSLTPSPERVAHWRAMLGTTTRPRVGVAWSGGATHRNDARRSIGLAPLRPLLSSGVELVSLQKDVDAEERALLEGRVRHFEQADFADTAALVSLMDAVVSVDTAVAHLAGALGRPVFIMLALVHDWRWLEEREDSPWYPTARLLRQAREGDWDGVVERVTGVLSRRAWTS